MDTVLDIHTRNVEKTRIIGALALASNLTAPLTYLDVGASWGVDNALVRRLCQSKKMRVVGFEPDPQEYAKLRAACPEDLYFECGLGDEDIERKFYNCASSANSSFLEPDLEAFSVPFRREQFHVVSTPQMAMRRVDSLIREGKMPAPDFVKIDAQGFEFNVLKGFGQELGRALGFRIETQLRPMYKGQAMFPEIYNLMRSRGFILRDIRPMWPDLYEVVEVEVYFSQDPRSVGDRFQTLKLWELMHDIPQGRTVIELADGKRAWYTIPM